MFPAIIERLTSALLAPGGRAAFSRILGPHVPAHGRWLDVGCGPRPYVENARLVGIDIDFAAVRCFARRAPALVGNAALLPFGAARFEGVVSIGLLHHLDNNSAANAVREMLRVTAPGGTIVVIDGVLPTAPRRRPLAALIRALDRGHHLRSADDLAALLEAPMHWERSTVTYAVTGLEALVAVHVRPLR